MRGLVCLLILRLYIFLMLLICYYACFSDRTCKIWDLSNSEEILTLDGHPNNVVGVQYAQVTSLIYTVSAYVVKVWDPRRGNVCIKTLTLVCLAFCICLVWLCSCYFNKCFYTTHTHNRFTALLEFVWDHPDEQVPER